MPAYKPLMLVLHVHIILVHIQQWILIFKFMCASMYRLRSYHGIIIDVLKKGMEHNTQHNDTGIHNMDVVNIAI